MEVVWILLIGLVAGWLAGLIMKTPQSGLLKNIVIGVLGALLGGWLFPKFGVSFAGLTGTILMATGGSVVLIFLLRLIA